MNLAFLCLYIMNRILSHILCFLLVFGLLSCEDILLEDNMPIVIEEPVDALVRLSEITVAPNANATPLQTINFTYTDQLLMEEVNFTGERNVRFSFNYAANNQLTQIEKMESGTLTTQLINYSNNLITISQTNLDNTRLITELRIDSQNRINQSTSFTVNTTGNRTQINRFQYFYTENFNVSRINKLNSSNNLERYSEFTYFFNNNPFQDMNDMIRFLVFEDFTPYTRYLPLTRTDFDRVGANFAQARSIQYNYTLQPDDFLSERSVEITTGGNQESMVEFYKYLP